MQFILIGFNPDAGFRVFAFEGIGTDQTRTQFTVRTDLALIRKYDIRVQELPLLCRGLLERREVLEQGEEGALQRTLTFTEEEMQLHAHGRAADRDAADKRKSTRRAPPTRVAPGTKFHTDTAVAPAQATSAAILY